jgi:predicted porin
MKNRLLAFTALLMVLGAAEARADDLSDLRQQTAELKKHNETLIRRLEKLEKGQSVKQSAHVAGQATGQPRPPAAAPEGFLAQAAASPATLLTGEGPLTWNGITVFGTIDAGLGWASSGLPINGKYYQGAEVVNRYAHNAYFGVVPNGLSNSTIGIKGSEEILPGLSGVFYASTFFNPQSGQLQNAPGAIVDNQGLNRNQYSNFGDGSRGGQAFNDQLYVGLASRHLGQLTFGRQRPLSDDLKNNYDPAAANAFSIITNSGTYVSGLGNSASARWDDAFKYRLEYGPVHFSATYKFADGDSGSNVGNAGTVNTNTVPGGAPQYFATKNDAGQIGLGGSYAGLDIDGVLGYFHQAISTSSPLTSAQLGGTSTYTSNQFTATNGNQVTTSTGNANTGTLSSTASDITGGVIGAKYTWNQFKFFAGWAHEIYHNPANNVGVGAQADQGGYVISSINNGSFPHAKILDNIWLGAKYAYDAKTDITLAWYHTQQNGYGWAANTPGVSYIASTSLNTCSLPAYLTAATKINGASFAAQSAPRSATCSGALNGVSGFVDYHFDKRFDIYGGILYSVVTGGLASNYYNPNNFAPTIGARYSF